MKKVFVFVVTGVLSSSAFAQIRDFQTTRLNSSAGAGVASILSTEAAILNPASSAFFEGSSASYQTYTTSLRKENSLRKSVPDNFAKHNRSQGLFVADNSGPVKGGVAYIDQKENGYERNRMTLHGGAPIGTETAMGFSYNYVHDQLPSKYKDRHQIHHQLRVGTTHILSNELSLGFVLVDPTRTIAGNERFETGLQLNLTDKLMVIADAGVQYTKAISQRNLWRAALQVTIMSDLFFRVGKFYDNIQGFRGTGWGVSWIGPRLGVEFAQKFSDQFGPNTYLYQDEKLIDTSLSAVIKF